MSYSQHSTMDGRAILRVDIGFYIEVFTADPGPFGLPVALRVAHMGLCRVPNIGLLGLVLWLT